MKEVHFTPAQQEAIDISRRHLDTCVVAGPGSGKTTVLVEYFRRLVAEGIDPLRILAITFTEKAAGNMRDKLAKAFHDDAKVRARLERAWVSTVHGFCARVLRENAVFAGVDPEFYVADERESWRLQLDSMAKVMEEVFRDDPAGVRALIRALSSPDFESDILSAYDAMRGAGISVSQLAAFAPPPGVTTQEVAETLASLRRASLRGWNDAQRDQFDAAMEGAERILGAQSPREALRAIEEFDCNLTKCKRGNPAYDLLKHLKDDLISDWQYALITACYTSERRLLLDILCRFDQMYRERKRQAGALDFADLEEFTVRLLEDHSDTRARLQGQFDHILMDEFQDTNGQQSKLLRLVRPPERFYAVGDINQSIFGFRHAEPRGFQEYRDEVHRGGKRLVELTDNFRSRPEILRAVETITAGAQGIEPRSLVPGKTFTHPRPVCVELMAIAGDESAEAQWVSRRILEIRDAEPELEFSDIALLVRNTEVLQAFTSAFENAGIPYLVNRGRGFYDGREVNDLTHLLRVIANPRDEVSMAVVLRSPLVGISDEELLQLKLGGDNLGATLLAAAAPAVPNPRLAHFAARLREWRARREAVTFDALLMAAIDDCGYPESPNLDKFLAQARDAASRLSLDEFVEELALVRASNPREPDAPPEDSANAVKVMTVHSAKGLEFPVVFVTAIHKGIDTSLPVISFSRHYGLGARWRNPAKREEKDDLYQHAIRDERKLREAEESNRLLYVAMTRAEQLLILSFARNGRKPQKWAGVVTDSLMLDVEIPREEVLSFDSPDGKPWNLRLLVAGEPGSLPAPQRPLPTPTKSLEVVPPPAIGDQHDSNATVTQLRVFVKCAREYYLRYYVGFEGSMPIPETPSETGISADELGNQVHALLSGMPVPNAHPEALRMENIFRQSALGRRVARAKRVEREFDFLVAIEDLVVRGQIDLWFEEGGEVIIVDYKTDDVTAVEAHQRARDYELQLRIYAAAVEQVVGRPPKSAWLYFLRPNTVVEVDLTPSLLESPDVVIREFQHAQTKMQFPLNEGGHCRRCPFVNGLCPAMLADVVRPIRPLAHARGSDSTPRPASAPRPESAPLPASTPRPASAPQSEPRP